MVRVPSGNTSRFAPSFSRSSHFLTRPKPDLLWTYPASRAVPEKIIFRARLPFIRQTARGSWETTSTASSRHGMICHDNQAARPAQSGQIARVKFDQPERTQISDKNTEQHLYQPLTKKTGARSAKYKRGQGANHADQRTGRRKNKIRPIKGCGLQNAFEPVFSLCRHPLKIHELQPGAASLRFWNALFKGEVCGRPAPFIS